jgi:hypothetical protein
MAARPPAQIRLRTFRLPKRGHTEEEYEDAFAVPVPHFPFRAAVADGATESAFSGPWARMLAEGWLAEDVRSETDFLDRLAVWQAQWQTDTSRQTPGKPWYVVEKAAQGAHAAFLGVHIELDGKWFALAVGDCCLFHVRERDRLLAWPLDTPTAFSHTPDLVPSRGALLPGQVLVRTGSWQPGDTLISATDALAAWIMTLEPAAVLGWDQTAFAQDVEKARSDGRLRNDDVTIVIIDLQEGGAA